MIKYTPFGKDVFTMLGPYTTAAVDFYELTIEKLWVEHAIWSQTTFGTDQERGPIGAMKHLAKETEEMICAAQEVADAKGYVRDKTLEEMRDRLLVELADGLLLLLDSTRRSGFTFPELVKAAYDKLQECKKRHYPKPAPGDNTAVEHDRSKDV